MHWSTLTLYKYYSLYKKNAPIDWIFFSVLFKINKKCHFYWKKLIDVYIIGYIYRCTGYPRRKIISISVSSFIKNKRVEIKKYITFTLIHLLFFSFFLLHFWVVSHIQNFGDSSYLFPGDAVICHWGYIISFSDVHLLHSRPHLFARDDVAPARDVEDLQNFGYVTLLAIVDICSA